MEYRNYKIKTELQLISHSILNLKSGSIMSLNSWVFYLFLQSSILSFLKTNQVKVIKEREQDSKDLLSFNHKIQFIHCNGNYILIKEPHFMT